MSRLLIAVVFISLFVIGCKSDLHKTEKSKYPSISHTDVANDLKHEALIEHIVFFSLKSEIPITQRAKLISEINKLKDIPEVLQFSVGNFKDLKDKRALMEYQMAMTMKFRTSEDYRSYQNHPIHLRLKKEIGKYLSGPPATYDFDIYGR